MMISLLSIVVFASMVALVLLLIASERFSFLAARRRMVISLFLAFVVAVNLIVAAVPLDLWPFSDWPLIALYHPAEASHVRLAAVDEKGVEHPVDARAVAPLSYIEVMAWLDSSFLKLPADQKNRALAELLRRIETARKGASERGSLGGRPLGTLTSPYFLMTPRFWDGAGLPLQHLVGLRVYRDRWNLEERARDERAVRSEIVFEYREPAR